MQHLWCWLRHRRRYWRRYVFESTPVIWNTDHAYYICGLCYIRWAGEELPGPEAGPGEYYERDGSLHIDH